MASDGFLYEKIAAALADQIRRANLRPGERCPSIRQVCREFDVSLATAVQALSLLERQGLVEARPQSGYYVRAVVPSEAQLGGADRESRPRQAACRVVNEALINAVVAAARDPHVVPLGAATPAPELLPAAALQRAVAAAARELGPDALQYEMPAGNEELRRQIARRAARGGVSVSAEGVVIVGGAIEAIHVALASVTKPGDTVAIECPIFFGILELIAALDLRVVPITTDPRTGLDVACLARVLKARRVAAVLAIPNYTNPAGGCMPDAAKQALVELVAGAGVPLIEDDIYGDLHHDGRRPPAAKAFDRGGDVIYCSSFSKTLAPGLRLGWILPGRYAAQIEKRKAVSTIACPTLMQAALAHYLAGDGYEKHLRRLRARLAMQVAQYTEAVLAAFPKGTKVSRPEGGFVLWVQLPDGGDANALFERARDKRISIVPGPSFAAEPGYFKDFIRISCGSPLTRPMAAALRTLGRLAQEAPVRRVAD